MKATTLTAAVALALLVAACGEKAAEPATATPAPAEAAARPAPVTNVSAALSLEPGVVHPMDAGLLASIKTPVGCSIDSINGKPLAEVALSTQGSTRFSGWISGNVAGEASAIALVGDSSVVFRNVIIAERPDIAQVIKLAAGTVHDFRVDIALKDVAPGWYKIHVLGTQGDGIGQCEGNTSVLVK